MSIRQFSFRTLVPSILPAILQWFTLATLDGVWRSAGLVDLVLYGGISLTVYALSFRLLSLRSDERVVANRWLQKCSDRVQFRIRRTFRPSTDTQSTTAIGEEPC